MAMTTGSLAPKVSPNPGSPAEKAEQKAVAHSELDGILDQVTVDFRDGLKEEDKESIAAQLKQAISGTKSKALQDLTEDDAYNYDVAIAAPASYSPDFLKIKLKDTNYIPRWCNTNSIWQSKLAGKGFRKITPDEVENLTELEMFLDSKNNFIWSDLVGMKILKSVYYSGIRRAHMKSLQATNAKTAARAGAAFAANQHTAALSAQQREYLAQHDLAEKPIYSPTIGV